VKYRTNRPNFEGGAPVLTPFTGESQIWRAILYTHDAFFLAKCRPDRYILSTLQGVKPLQYRVFDQIFNIGDPVPSPVCRSEPNLTFEGILVVCVHMANFIWIGLIPRS